MTALYRVDPTKNMSRFYCVSVEKSLFGEWLVVKQWGRIGGRGRRRDELTTDFPAAHRRVQELVSVKKRRGYVEAKGGAEEGRGLR